MASEIPCITFDSTTSSDLWETHFETVVEKLNDREVSYLRARALLDGPRRTYLVVVDECVSDLAFALGQAAMPAFFSWARKYKPRLKRIALNAAARLALLGRSWADAADLASEVVARDHHDIMAQRIIDAAAEESAELETEADRWLATRTCRAPFRQMETRANGMVHFCCSAWQPVPIGKLEDRNGEDFWTSRRASEIRRSVTEGDFTHCSRWHCPMIAGRRLPARTWTDADHVLPKGPSRVILSHDRSCNISCPSCRTDVISLDHQKSRDLDRLFEARLLPILDEATEIKVTGSGDPFGSRHFRNVLKALTARPAAPRRLQLHTNGLLANERAWNELNLWDNVSSVWVSVDAAEPETYAELRRGGTFDQLRGALDFLGDLRARQAINSFRLDFVVQARNFREMGDFVDLARQVGADGVYFLRLRNWGHVPVHIFRTQDVCSPDHTEHSSLLEVLADPRLCWEGVELGSMSALVRTARNRTTSA